MISFFDFVSLPEWTDTDNIQFDFTVLFSDSYDDWGLKNLRQECTGPNGNYLIWPSHSIGPIKWKYSIYRDSDGLLMFKSFNSREEAEEYVSVLFWDNLDG